MSKATFLPLLMRFYGLESMFELNNSLLIYTNYHTSKYRIKYFVIYGQMIPINLKKYYLKQLL